jgi:hypothetical protein
MELSDSHSAIPLISNQIDGSARIYEIRPQIQGGSWYWGVHIQGYVRHNVAVDIEDFALSDGDRGWYPVNGRIGTNTNSGGRKITGPEVILTIFLFLTVILVVAALSKGKGGGSPGFSLFNAGYSGDSSNDTLEIPAGTETEVFLVFPAENGVDPSTLKLVY